MPADCTFDTGFRVNPKVCFYMILGYKGCISCTSSYSDDDDIELFKELVRPLKFFFLLLSLVFSFYQLSYLFNFGLSFCGLSLKLILKQLFIYPVFSAAKDSALTKCFYFIIITLFFGTSEVAYLISGFLDFLDEF